MNSSNRVVMVLAASAVWMGLLIGVSFVATPVKFLAPSLTLSVALDVGRQTFWGLNLIEIIVATGLLLLILWGFPTILGIGIGVALAIAVIWQTVWLIPLLDARVSIIMSGQALPPSPLHAIYVAMETLKVVLLLVLLVESSRALLRSVGRRSA